MTMNRVGSISHLDHSDTDKELWIERLQQRPYTPATQAAENREDSGIWIERLQQRRFFPADKDA
jgi:hypothetical protein